jgi:O-antigen ligase
MALAWTTFAFGGVYGGTLVVPGLLTAALAVAYRPRVLGGGPAPRLDRWLLVATGAMVLQLLPLPRSVVGAISPAALWAAERFALVAPAGPIPLALDLQDASGAVVLFAGSLLLFATARQVFDTGGVRTVARGIAVAGLALAALAIAQAATAHGLMYWRWRPVYERAFPFGPFVNRNHFGTWAMMAVPLCIGYLLAHLDAHRAGAPGSWRRRIVAALDGRAWLLLVSIVMLMAATAVSLSRSALLGMTVAVLTGGLLARRRGRLAPHGHGWSLAAAIGGGTAMAAVLLGVEPTAVTERLAASGVGLAGRVEIWRTTLRILEDFPLTGTGVGTFQSAMVLYQQSSAGVIFNQAHNHYLQVAAEGGLLVGVPIALAMAAFARSGAEALARDASGMFWLRAGAASGLAGVAAQSLFEAGLLTPANALLAAVLAAIVLHVPGRYGPDRLR